VTRIATARELRARSVVEPIARVDTRRLAHAMTMRLFPVKSSAPPTTTRTRPTLNATPARTRMAPQGADPTPAIAVVAKTPPSAMKVPETAAPPRPLGCRLVRHSLHQAWIQRHDGLLVIEDAIPLTHAPELHGG
jgi:hypothetical protein